LSILRESNVQFNVSLLRREPTGSRREHLVDEPFRPLEDDSRSYTVKGPVVLLRTNSGVLATAHLRSEASGECARCLNPVNYPVSLEIEEEFLPTFDPVTGAALPAPEEPGVQTIDTHHVLDLTDAARQAWLLSEPMQILCRPECQGLCHTCGSDLNLGECACNRAPLDSRWAALASYRSLQPDRQEEN
jgi:uncharacterized protein